MQEKKSANPLIFNNINKSRKMSDHWSVQYWYLLFFAVLTNGFYPTGVSFICTIDIPPPPFHISRPLSWDRFASKWGWIFKTWNLSQNDQNLPEKKSPPFHISRPLSWDRCFKVPLCLSGHLGQQAAGTKEASMEINQSMNGIENRNQVEQISPDANNLCTF